MQLHVCSHETCLSILLKRQFALAHVLQCSPMRQRVLTTKIDGKIKYSFRPLDFANLIKCNIQDLIKKKKINKLNLLLSMN